MGKELTSAEVSNLWNSYLANNMAIYVGQYLLHENQDSDTREMLNFANEIAENDSKKAEFFFKEADYPLPEGFSDKDYTSGGARLFTDKLICMLKFSLAHDANIVYSVSLSTSTRKDIRDFFENSMRNAARLCNICSEIMVKKGWNNPLIHVPKPGKIEKVDDQGYLTGWLGDKRPINALEINLLTFNFTSMEILKEILRSFSQVTGIPELREHYLNGVDTIKKQLGLLQSILVKNELPEFPSLKSEVTGLHESPLSERIMLFKVSLMTSGSAIRYGIALSTVMRRDLGAHYVELLREQLKYGESCLKLMIKYGYLDKIPMAVEK